MSEPKPDLKAACERVAGRIHFRHCEYSPADIIHIVLSEIRPLLDARDKKIERLKADVSSLGNDLVRGNDIAFKLRAERDALQKDSDRLRWLHAPGPSLDDEGYEWGIFRVKWNAQGQPEKVMQTLSDFSDLDKVRASEAGEGGKQDG